MAECPRRAKGQEAQMAAMEQTEIAFHVFANEVETGSPLENGYAVVDCGATSSLGSVDALEAIMSKNIRETGDGKIEIDTDRRPVFKFLVDGSLEVHVHDSPNQPVLLSRSSPGFGSRD